MSIINLFDGTIINPAHVITISRTDSTIKFELVNGKSVYEKHEVVDAAAQYQNIYAGILATYIDNMIPTGSAPTEFGDIQMIYADPETPEEGLTPDDPTKFALYRSTPMNTLWFWNTVTQVWYPVIDAI